MDFIHKVASTFRKRGADTVIHLSDYCSPFSIAPFEGGPMQGILGNNDGCLCLLMEN